MSWNILEKIISHQVMVIYVNIMNLVSKRSVIVIGPQCQKKQFVKLWSL